MVMTENASPDVLFVYAFVHFCVHLSTFLCTPEYIFVYTWIHSCVHFLVLFFVCGKQKKIGLQPYLSTTDIVL